MADNLFNDFEPVSSKQWKQQIQFELKGADYNDTLIWNSPEDIKVKPFYHNDEFKEDLSVHTKATAFKIGQSILLKISPYRVRGRRRQRSRGRKRH